MEIYSQTDIGLVRSSNQDAEMGGKLPDGAVWTVVCDGMGGVNGGNIASALAVKEIARQIQNTYRSGCSEDAIKSIIVTAIYNANEAVYQHACANIKLRGMGTTVVTAIVTDGIAHVAHAGDSRAYLVYGGEIRQITTDHSMVQEMVNNGDLDASEAKSHPQRNIITRALGVEPTVEIDYVTCAFLPGSQLLICTDGLTNHVDEAQILELTLQMAPKPLCGALVSLAKAGGGSDNITVAVVRN